MSDTLYVERELFENVLAWAIVMTLNTIKDDMESGEYPANFFLLTFYFSSHPEVKEKVLKLVELNKEKDGEKFSVFDKAVWLMELVK